MTSSNETRRSIAPVNVPIITGAAGGTCSQAYLQDELSTLLKETLNPTLEENLIHDEIFTYLKEIIQTQYLGAAGSNSFELKRFGSTVSGFSLRNADLDFCLFMDLENKFDESVNTKHNEDYLNEFPILPSKIADSVAATDNSKVTSPPPGLNSVPKETHQPAPCLASRAVLELGTLLRQHPRVTDIKVLSHARIPIIKFRDLSSGLTCDLGVNNRLALYNTQLLKLYGQIDDRVIPLALLIKHWSKKRAMNEPYLGTLSSYCWILLVIHYLQGVVKPAILPVLQDPSLIESIVNDLKESENDVVDECVNGFPVKLIKNLDLLIDHWRNAIEPDILASVPAEENLNADDTDSRLTKSLYDFKINTNDLSSPTIDSSTALSSPPLIYTKFVKNDSSLIQLLQGFFKYYAYDFSYSSHVISIRILPTTMTNGTLTKVEKEWTIEHNALKENYWFCVEDPFETTHNLARVVNRNRYFIHFNFQLFLCIFT